MPLFCLATTSRQSDSKSLTISKKHCIAATCLRKNRQRRQSRHRLRADDGWHSGRIYGTKHKDPVRVDTHCRSLLRSTHAAVGHTYGAPPSKAHTVMAQRRAESAARRKAPAETPQAATGKGMPHCSNDRMTFFIAYRPK